VIDVSEIITDPDFCQEFTVYRSTGSFIKGVWTESTPIKIKMMGVVLVMNAKELNMVPEGDRIAGAMTFYSTEQIYTTRTGDEQGTSDKILWRGEYYKVFNVYPWIDYGYFEASGTRIKGA
jgi:hypothetical protein